MEKMTSKSPSEQTQPSPEAVNSGETTFNSLKQEVQLNVPSPEPVAPALTAPEKAATLSNLRQELEDVYQQPEEPKVDEVSENDAMPEVTTLDTPEATSIDPDNDGIDAKERPKFDLINKARDRVAVDKIDKLLTQCEDAPDNQAEYLAQAKELLNPYIANQVFEYCWEHSDNEMSFELLNQFSTNTIKHKFSEMHDEVADSVGWVENYSSAPNKVQNALTDLAVDRILANQEGDFLVRDFRGLSEENHEKLFKAFCQNENIDQAVQCLTPNIGQKYREQLASQLQTPFQFAHAVQNGGLFELAPPDFVETLQLSMDGNRNEAQQLATFKRFGSIKTAVAFGPELITKIADYDYYGQPEKELIAETDAISIKSAHEFLKSNHYDFGHDFATYLCEHPDTANAIAGMEHFSNQDAHTLELAAEYGIAVKDPRNFHIPDDLVQEKTTQNIQNLEHYYNERIQRHEGDGETQEIWKKKKIDSVADEISKYFLGQSKQNTTAICETISDQINSLDSKAQTAVSIANDLLNCDNVEGLKDFYQQAKDRVHPKELKTIFNELKSEHLAKITANYKTELLSNEKAATLGLESDTVTYQEHEIPTYKIDGQNFSLLVHKLGAFGKTDFSNPSVWDTRTSGNPYISTTLIGDKCLRLAGGTERKALDNGVFYGFGELDDRSILGMGQEDLYTKQDRSFSYLYKNGNENGDTNIKTTYKETWYENTDDLLNATLQSDSKYNYNEVVLDRYRDNRQDRLHPSCIVVFGTDTSQISEAALKHADYFKVPIYLINDKKCRQRRRLIKKGDDLT